MSTYITTEIKPTVSTTEQFQTSQVLPIAGAHFIHDIYTAYVSPLLPVLIQKFSFSLTQAGTLTAFLQLPSLLTPFIGYLADRVSLRYFVILTPAITGTLISCMGFAPSYYSLALILLLAGISTAAFHAPAPAMIGRVAGTKIGLGMSLFMAAGELSRTIGPLLAVWAVTTWTLEGIYRTAILGWVATIILFLRLRHVSARPDKSGQLRSIVPILGSLFLPLSLINILNDFMLACMTYFLPTYMGIQGATLIASGAALSIFSLAGAIGALTSGSLSDLLGRRKILIIATVSSAILMLFFIRSHGWLLVPLLLLLGFTALSRTPVMLALVQESLPNNRAVGNGLFMFISFLVRPITTIVIGAWGDHFGLESAFFWSALISLFSIPAIIALPHNPKIS